MNFELDFRVLIDQEAVDSKTLMAGLAGRREALADPCSIEGGVVVRIDGEEVCGDYADPLLRLAGLWVRKIPWILAGDTETVALRNSEHCFAFVPAGDSVEISFFAGSETEIEEYILEPTNVRIDQFATQSLQLAERLLELVRALDPKLLESSEDCRDLVASYDEGRGAWRDHQVHSRR